MRLSIFWRLALSSLAIITVMAAVNLYALVQLRQLTALSSELVAFHYPSIEGANTLIEHLYTQHRDEQKYLAVKDPAFQKDFDDEAEHFRRRQMLLLNQERSEDARALLQRVMTRQLAYQDLFRQAAASQAGLRRDMTYESRRNALIAEMTETLQKYIELHDVKIDQVVNDSHVRLIRAEVLTQQLVIGSLFLGLLLAGIASYSILQPLRRLQDHIARIGQGKFGGSLEVSAPRDLQELVETANLMGEKLQALDDMKAEFLANISHELRTPLASIREGTHLLLEEIPGPLSSEQRQTLRIMADSSERLIHLISSLLDLSKMEAGMMDYRIAPGDLKRIAEGSVKKVRLLAEGQHIQILTEISEGPLSVPVDTARVEEVLDNLLSNALKYSPNGSVVKLRLAPDHHEGVVHVSVSDTGPGIAPEDKPHVFDRFYQGRLQGKNGMAGTGLGLALAKKVVEAHGGTIRIDSETGKGTTVEFVLPLTSRDNR